jgi:5-methylcytosine-specific restriction protein B
VGVPRSLPYPQNLFVIGTVNVDETTYMFSPKVLDRAHVIEFEVDRGDVGKFLEDPKPLQPVPRAAPGQAEAFLALSLRARGLQEPPLPELPPAVKTEVNRHLLEVLEILQNGRFEFAFRTAKEVVAYLKVSHELAADKAAWEAGKGKSDLDDEILQKILPRLHGSRTRVGPLLGALGWYLHTGDKEEAEKFFPAPGEELPEKPVQEIIALHKAAAAFPRSFAKVQRMARVVIEEQFVSFIC